MKKNLMILAVAALAALTSCTGKKTAHSEVDKDSTDMAGYTTTEDSNVTWLLLPEHTRVLSHRQTVQA